MRTTKEETVLAKRVYLHDLYDLYAPLLTEKQREAWDLHEFADFSLAETAEKLGICRQGVSDLITRSRDRLEELESLLGFFHKEDAFEEEIRELRRRIEHLSSGRGGAMQKAEGN